MRVTLCFQEETEYAYFLSTMSLQKNYESFLKISHKEWPKDVFFIDLQSYGLLSPNSECDRPFLLLRILGIRSKK